MNVLARQTALNAELLLLLLLLSLFLCLRQRHDVVTNTEACNQTETVTQCAEWLQFSHI